MLEATNCSQHPHLCTQRPKHKAFLLSGDRGELLYRLHWLQYNCITAHVPSWAQRPAACAHVCLFDFSFLYNMPPSECLAGIVFHPTNCLRSFTKAALLIVLSGSFHTLVFKPPPPESLTMCQKHVIYTKLLLIFTVKNSQSIIIMHISSSQMETLF